MSEMIPAFAKLIAFERLSNDAQFTWAITGWMNSYRPYWEQYENRQGKDFYKVYRPYIVKMLSDKPPLMAVLKDEPDVFLSFCCGEEGHIYYVYTKGEWRRNALASVLIDEECGKKPGCYHSKTFKRYFLRSLRDKGWRYEKEK